VSVPSRRRAEQQAENLLIQQGIATFPTPVEDIARDLGAKLLYQRMDPDVSGMVYRDGQTTYIGINNNHHPRRQRFTAAHEIAHLQLHPGRPLTVDSSIRVNFRDNVSSQATDRQEIEANAFAAALLMPRDQIIDQAEKLQAAGVKTRERLVTNLAKIFDVSNEAMGHRLVNLGVIAST
jgi:Zn-dependent peptidase ImmA (M78 family)